VANSYKVEELLASKARLCSMQMRIYQHFDEQAVFWT